MTYKRNVEKVIKTHRYTFIARRTDSQICRKPISSMSCSTLFYECSIVLTTCCLTIPGMYQTALYA